jgi:hypothetical protein
LLAAVLGDEAAPVVVQVVRERERVGEQEPAFVGRSPGLAGHLFDEGPGLIEAIQGDFRDLDPDLLLELVDDSSDTGVVGGRRELGRVEGRVRAGGARGRPREVRGAYPWRYTVVDAGGNGWHSARRRIT